MIPEKQDIAPSTLSFRPARVADAEALKRACWADRTLANVVELLRRSEKLAQQRRGLALVAVWQGTPCAFGLLTVWPRAGEISDLVVEAALRGRGIGSQLIDRLSQAASALGVQTLEIGAALSNPRALALYRRLGFLDARVLELDVGCGPEPVVYLVKDLGIKDLGAGR